MCRRSKDTPRHKLPLSAAVSRLLRAARLSSLPNSHPQISAEALVKDLTFYARVRTVRLGLGVRIQGQSNFLQYVRHTHITSLGNTGPNLTTLGVRFQGRPNFTVVRKRWSYQQLLVATNTCCEVGPGVTKGGHVYMSYTLVVSSLQHLPLTPFTHSIVLSAGTDTHSTVLSTQTARTR